MLQVTDRAQEGHMGEIRVGCSGFSYDDWVGHFYSPGASKRDYLTLYAEHFDTVEINVTYYQVPPPITTRGWVRRTPDGFLFAVKAHKSMTHEPKTPDEAIAGVPLFLESMAPVVEASRLACVLLQFPWGFRPTHQSRDILEALLGSLASLPLVCEFRHVDWVRDSVKGWLRERGVGYCCVDQPDLATLMPRESVATSPLAYIRFHGRNRAKWFNHREAWERYDYLYSDEELREWVKPVRDLATQCDRVLVYFNNHRMGQAPANTAVFRELIAASDTES